MNFDPADTHHARSTVCQIKYRLLQQPASLEPSYSAVERPNVPDAFNRMSGLTSLVPRPE